MAQKRIEIRDGREFRVTVLKDGDVGKLRCFKCKRLKHRREIATSGQRRNGTTWHLCKRCGTEHATG